MESTHYPGFKVSALAAYALANAKEENVNIHATLDKTLEDLNSF